MAAESRIILVNPAFEGSAGQRPIFPPTNSCPLFVFLIFLFLFFTCTESRCEAKEMLTEELQEHDPALALKTGL